MNSTDIKKVEFISAAIREGKESTLPHLIELFSVPEDIFLLDRIQCVIEELQKWDLGLFPDIKCGNIDSVRLVKNKNIATLHQDQIDLDIKSFESSNLEFKGTFLFDIKKYSYNSGLPIKQYRSEEVLHSTIKTIAAFLNCGGGILYIGVNDDGTIHGLHEDCKILGGDSFNADTFQLELRNQVGAKFMDGKTINDYINLCFYTKDGYSFARLQVAKRNKIAYVKKENQWTVYRRQGNRTVEVRIEELEEYIYYRKDQGWSKG
jgi:hypothetical protein